MSDTSQLDPEPWEAEQRAQLERLNAKPWRGACPLCSDRLWCTDTEAEARQLVSEHIADRHAVVPQVWQDHAASRA